MIINFDSYKCNYMFEIFLGDNLHYYIIKIQNILNSIKNSLKFLKIV